MKKLSIVFVLLLSFLSITFTKPIFEFFTKVVNVHDGDTIWVEEYSGANLINTRIRILGIDSPELYHTGMVAKDYKFYGCGEKAKQIANKFLLNKKVKLYIDTDSKNIDRYNRKLRYVYVGLPYKGKIVYLPYGAIAIYLGYAKVYQYENFTYKKLYEKLEQKAKKAKRGIWSDKCQLEDKKIKEEYKKLQIQKEQQKNENSKTQQNFININNKETPENNSNTNKTYSDCGYSFHKEGCDIKGNINSKGKKLYHLPSRKYYSRTKITPSKGERWFCNEQEAINCGWEPVSVYAR